MKFCSIATAPTLPHARVLAGALAEHQHGDPLTVLVLSLGPVGDEPFDHLTLAELGCPETAERLRGQRRWRDLAEYAKPYLLRKLLGGDASGAIFLDVQVDVVAPLEPVIRELERSSAVLCPRTSGELPDDSMRPNVDDLSVAGRVSSSLVAVSRHGGEFLDWWGERVEAAAHLHLEPGSVPDPLHPGRDFVRPRDLAPSVLPDVKLLADRGCAVSYWNLHERRLGGDPGASTLDGVPLRFMHFEGFDPERPFWLSDCGSRVRVPDSPILGRLCESYAARLRAAGWTDARRRADVGRQLPNGMTFDNRLSSLHAAALTEGAEVGNVFTPDGVQRFMRWMAGPSPHGAAHGINRYTYRIYQEREDLPRAFPDLDGADGPKFARWTYVFGVPEAGIPRELLPKMDEAPALSPLPRASEEQAPELAVNAVGFFGHALGLGQAARGYVAALQAVGVPMSTTSVEIVLPEYARRQADRESYGRVHYEGLEQAKEANFNLVFVNPDELPMIASQLPEAFLESRPCIGVWGWEVDYVPDRWRRAYRYLDEVWVYSRFMAQNLGRAVPMPTIAIPPPVIPPDPHREELEFELPDGFRFLFAFDFFSTIQRKNPIGLVRAFRRAFKPGDGPQLVIKTINAPDRPAAYDALRYEALGRPDIHVIDRSLAPRQRDALFAACDCYVSLHRSEGFGLTIAEAMALGKPVIATAYSGSVDFTTVGNSYLVDYDLVRVGPDVDIYPPNGIWAEPSVEHAAELMRRVVEHPEEARAKAQRGMREIRENFSPEASGTLAQARLERLARAMDQANAPPADGTVPPLLRRLAGRGSRRLPPRVRTGLRNLG